MRGVGLSILCEIYIYKSKKKRRDSESVRDVHLLRVLVIPILLQCQINANQSPRHDDLKQKNIFQD